MKFDQFLDLVESLRCSEKVWLLYRLIRELPHIKCFGKNKFFQKLMNEILENAKK